MRQGDGLKQNDISRNLDISFGTVLKQCLFLIIIACLIGWVINYQLLSKSFSGELRIEIQKKQLADLKVKAKQVSPGVKFIDLVSAKKLYDEQQAIFLDARSPEEYAKGTIYEAIGLSIMSVVKGSVNIEKLIPNKNALIVSFCSGGECDAGVELAEELAGRGYTNIFVLGEGYPGWRDAYYPVSIPKRGVDKL